LLKKERQKKLLDESERSQSNAGKADEIRARRAAEERERRMREKEREDAQRRKVGPSPSSHTSSASHYPHSLFHRVSSWLLLYHI
jgi:hypothetical protein